MDIDIRLYLGEMLLNKGVINKEQLAKALEERKRTNKPLGKIITDLGFVKEQDMVHILSEQLGITYVDLDSYIVDRDVIKVIPEKVAREIMCVPLFLMNDTLTIAMVDPLDVSRVDELKTIAKCDIDPVFATESSIKIAIEKYYGKGGVFSDISAPAEKQKENKVEAQQQINDLMRSAEDKPAMKMVDMLIEQAVRDGASDIHIEPQKDKLKVRMRIDGVLHDVTSPPKELELSIISRIKIIASMDIAEKRLPQDGRIQMSMGDKTIDMRISTFPTLFGENVVVRILEKSQILLDLNKLGFGTKVLEDFKKIIYKPHGINLVTGPTGSGKTTTLYGVLNMINSPTKNIITLEDPIEYVLEGVRQSQIDVKSGLTFANGLRSIVRQDPDVIMIGEIRDFETAEIAIHASLTGHLVFSTLHTNDAASAVTRLVDMGVEPYLVASSVSGVLAQRLVRVLCSKCKKKTHDGYEAVGCDACGKTGYKGRTGIFELMLVNDVIKDLIAEKVSASQLKKKAQELGMKTLYEDGLSKVKEGMTSLAEVMRVTQE